MKTCRLLPRSVNFSFLFFFSFQFSEYQYCPLIPHLPSDSNGEIWYSISEAITAEQAILSCGYYEQFDSAHRKISALEKNVICGEMERKRACSNKACKIEDQMSSALLDSS